MAGLRCGLRKAQPRPVSRYTGMLSGHNLNPALPTFNYNLDKINKFVNNCPGKSGVLAKPRLSTHLIERPPFQRHSRRGLLFSVTRHEQQQPGWGVKQFRSRRNPKLSRKANTNTWQPILLQEMDTATGKSASDRRRSIPARTNMSNVTPTRAASWTSSPTAPRSRASAKRSDQPLTQSRLRKGAAFSSPAIAKTTLVTLCPATEAVRTFMIS